MAYVGRVWAIEIHIIGGHMLGQFGGVLDVNLALALLVALTGGIIRGYSGFAGGLLLVPLFVILFGPVEGIAVATIAGLIGTVQMVPRAIKIAHWPEVGPVAVAIAFATPLGVMFLVSADPALVRQGMGIFIIFVAILLMTGWNYRGPRSIVASAAAGALAGGVTGAFGVAGGPFFVLYYLSSTQPAPVQRANIIISASCTITILLLGLIVSGRIGTDTLVRAVLVTPVFMIGTGIGQKLFQILPNEWFNKIVLWVLAATGVSMLIV